MYWKYWQPLCIPLKGHYFQFSLLGIQRHVFVIISSQNGEGNSVECESAKEPVGRKC